MNEPLIPEWVGISKRMYSTHGYSSITLAVTQLITGQYFLSKTQARERWQIIAFYLTLQKMELV